ncbi:LuxR family transcriptional regulator [Salmonella enterica subsp. diarizonae]|uniref:LuxR C-terminal-related transcriptional regulator n=1 Tax=Salmonella enterica TaxID=28901 RepID=UPI0009ADB3D5|nr:LuxR C-terminal-related transcriptional regulator [Salmonella enterica]EAW2451670.1 LuxR family transcriptional regulator [Salmonella enterica subsp. diarizonae]EHG2955461.1 LuxR family transcriptional regulator [Salmonella enterica subsp. diarizonae serovar 53:r:z35]EHG6070577.1 LuxR family transcriptional regulator [Salmonella enterica subsp. diarizonae serovar 61:z52:z53]EAS0548006.1 LuxR family transcriptional regulator [Salmonella enterica]EBF4785690.1 LuxR family transcriptional regul
MVKKTDEYKMLSFECLHFEFNTDCGLSESELCVVQLLLKGYTQKQIAAMRLRSVKTISAQKINAFIKLGVRSDITLLSVLLLKNMVKISVCP